ncbi:unnamed protein product [Phaedon cochleariae]|uniref:EGF-like domain-containing protein n=1 Tax=Phaedon cochleariae TaxID=80249 RepID=A0A9P0DW93_PHACE|nr:unnamed protein product [Phaedon cochleariae]
MLFPHCLCLFLLIHAHSIHFSYQGSVTNTPLLLYSTTEDIRLVNSSREYSRGKSVTLVKNYTFIAAIDFHYDLGKVFWVDHENETIFGIDYKDGTVKNKVEIVNDVLTPDGLACDWVTNKLYWTDSETKLIEVATIEGKYRKVLFWTDLDQPRAIALAPREGFMFWTDWGDSPKIERAGMDGDPSTRKVLVSEDKINWPNGLAVDYETNTVYWVDGTLKFIKKMDFNGKNLTKVLDKGLVHPYALTKFQSKFYWTDWNTGGIYVYDTDHKEPNEFISSTHPTGIRVWDESMQPKQSHPCQMNNGGCSHLCLISQDAPGFACACPGGIKLLDRSTCHDAPQEMLLLAKRTEICLVYLDSPEYGWKALPVGHVEYGAAVDFDPVDKFIYWSDEEVEKIQRARLDGSDKQDVVTTDLQDPEGIALDWLARNIYWTDTGTNRIEVARLETGFRKVIIMDKLTDPRAIAVAPALGWLFWSDWNEKDPKIERSNLDGTLRVAIVSERIEWPNGITLDCDRKRIYWGDAKLDVIEHADMDGGDRRELVRDVPHVFGFSLMGEYVYWTDWQRRAVERVHKETGSNRKIIVDQRMENVMGLKAIKSGDAEGWNPCKDANFNCSQLCFHRHDGTTVCACQIDYELAEDGRTCTKPRAFLLYAKRGSIGRMSIENENNEATIPIAGIKQASSIDFDTNTMRVYWTDSKARAISRAFVNGSDVQKVIDLGLAGPEGLAVDWLALNVYWTDPAAHRIEVARLTGTGRRTLLWDETYRPQSIVVEPVAGYMYWSETGSIKKATMDGKNHIPLVSTEELATSLTLDHDQRRLYWTETRSGRIRSADLNGHDVAVVVEDAASQPTGLTLFEDYVFWSDNKTGDIFRANKSNAAATKTRVHRAEGVADLSAYHDRSRRRRHANQCAISNGGCSHLCLALPPGGQAAGGQAADGPGYACACPNHYRLVDNGCIPPSSFMIYSLRNMVVRLVPDTSDCPEAVLPIHGLKAIKAIDFDPKSNFLYWIDGKSHSVKRSEASERKYEVERQKFDNIVVNNKESLPYDLAVDSIGRTLFWTCALKDVINVTRLDNSNPFGIIEKKDGEKPRLIALHVAKRLLFFTDVGKMPEFTQLIRTRLDGSHRMIIKRASNITAIAVDTENDLLIWAQGHSIYVSNIDGENQHVLLNESNSKIVQLTVHTGWLYWIDKEIDQLQRLEILSGKSRSVLPVQASHILDLISVQAPADHLCNLTHQKKCSHFCLHEGSSYVCACPQGLILDVDNKTCQPPPDCGAHRFTCTAAAAQKRDCIPIYWRCDQQRDCADGSDELGCHACTAEQFRCQDGQCIDRLFYCDHTVHCNDSSDEKSCCEEGYQCPQTEVCLPLSLVCDGNENCADGSDEKDCAAAKQPVVHIVLAAVGAAFAFALVAMLAVRWRRLFGKPDGGDRPDDDDALNPMQPSGWKNSKYRKGIPDVVRMSMLNDSGCPSTTDRRHITGASSSSNTNGSSCAQGGSYPRETLNPPPSPATTAVSTRGSSPSTRYRPYRHYRSINQPPPPTPCSTDVCDESDYNYPARGRDDFGPEPPPPTPRSHQQESCPPSPSSRSSTYFSPLPPPPSPVASPRGSYH